MTADRQSIVPAFWKAFYEATHVPAAVKVGDTIYVTGHTGESADGVFPKDTEDQIRGTFRNIGLTLAEAGASWADVVELTSYHVGIRSQFPDIAFRVAAEFLVDPYPAWTAAGVPELFDEEAVFEISCIAVQSR
jgi:enamine deaminase RidA (YjgF/YER057c/UK114 family)